MDCLTIDQAVTDAVKAKVGTTRVYDFPFEVTVRALEAFAKAVGEQIPHAEFRAERSGMTIEFSRLS